MNPDRRHRSTECGTSPLGFVPLAIALSASTTLWASLIVYSTLEPNSSVARRLARVASRDLNLASCTRRRTLVRRNLWFSAGLYFIGVMFGTRAAISPSESSLTLELILALLALGGLLCVIVSLIL